MLAISTVALAFVVSSPGLDPRPAPWGDEGHSIVCDIAWRYLTPTAQRRVGDLLTDDEWGTLASACTWPDRYARGRPQFDWAKPLHYIDVPIDAERVDGGRDHCPSSGCVTEAIGRFADQLRDETEPRWKRVNALRFLGHFVGDIHQPLHVAHADDCGGCSAKPSFHGRERKIHSIWDTSVLRFELEDYEPERDAGRTPHPAGSSWVPLAYDLASRITSDQRKAWASLDPVDWAQESLELAQGDLFDFDTGDELPDDYSAKAFLVIKERLQQGGLRLAYLLNEIFDPTWESP